MALSRPTSSTAVVGRTWHIFTGLILYKTMFVLVTTGLYVVLPFLVSDCLLATGRNNTSFNYSQFLLLAGDIKIILKEMCDCRKIVYARGISGDNGRSGAGKARLSWKVSRSSFFCRCRLVLFCLIFNSIRE